MPSPPPPPPASPSSPSSLQLQITNKSSFHFRSDIHHQRRDAHPSGMLHVSKRQVFNSSGHEIGREEQAFAWIQHRFSNEDKVQRVIEHLVGYGFDGTRLVFLPFSSLEGWMFRYPHACPYIVLDNDGTIKGMPYFDQCIPSSQNNFNNDQTSDNHNIHIPKIITDATQSTCAACRNGANSKTNDDSNHNSRPTKKQRRTKSSKLLPFGTLLDPQRNQLHIEIYHYFTWLHTQLLQIEANVVTNQTTGTTLVNGARQIRRAGISLPAMQNLITKLEGTFKHVGEYKKELAMVERQQREEEEKRRRRNNRVNDNENEEEVAMMDVDEEGAFNRDNDSNDNGNNENGNNDKEGGAITATNNNDSEKENNDKQGAVSASNSASTTNANDSEKENDTPTKPKPLPLLEQSLQDNLQQIVNEIQKQKEDNLLLQPPPPLLLSSSPNNNHTSSSGSNNNNNNGNNNSRSNNTTTVIDFETIFQALQEYKRQKNGSLQYIAYSYKIHVTSIGRKIPLGKWVYDVRRRKKELRSRGMEFEVPAPTTMIATTEEEEDGLPTEEEDGDDFVTLPISSGRLGLTLQFYKGGVGAVVTKIDDACTFKDQIEVGDRLVTIDGNVISKTEDLHHRGTTEEEEEENNNNEVVRMFGFAKKTKDDYPNTYLSMERVERLESIGFVWEAPCINPQRKSWDEWLQLLLQFKETHGKWPGRSEKWEGIGEWIHMQRRRYKNKDAKFMRERAPKLDEVGFPWATGRKPFTKIVSWEDHVQKLAEFYNVNRHFNVTRPQGDGKDDDDVYKEQLDFYKWVCSLPTWYRAYQEGKGRQTRLNEERINQLLEMGFDFEKGNKGYASKRFAHTTAVPDIPFEKRVEQLQQFQEECGHMDIDPRFRLWDNFGGWAAQVSKQYKEWQEGTTTISSTTESQLMELSALGFEFNSIPDNTQLRTWDDNFDAFRNFVEVHGHGLVPQQHKEDIRLAHWVGKQRLEYKLVCNGKKHSQLTQERIEKMENCGFVWVVREDSQRRSWDESFQILLQFKETQGKWPGRSEKWEGIGEWVHGQRKRYKKKNAKFMMERAPKLDEVGFPWVQGRNS